MAGNWFKTTVLMAAIVALFGMVGAALGRSEERRVGKEC